MTAITDHFKKSLYDAIVTCEGLSAHEDSLEKAVTIVTQSLLNGRKLLFCGNGGSASDSAHIATEFTCRFKDDRRPYPAMALTIDGGLITAIGNDYHFDHLFERQVRAFGQQGDVLIVLTTSGNSRNIFLAIEEAKKHGLTTIAFLGKTGGFTTGIADIEMMITGDNTARIQEAQKFLLHLLCELVEDRLPKE